MNTNISQRSDGDKHRADDLAALCVANTKTSGSGAHQPADAGQAHVDVISIVCTIVEAVNPQAKAIKVGTDGSLSENTTRRSLLRPCAPP